MKSKDSGESALYAVEIQRSAERELGDLPDSARADAFAVMDELVYRILVRKAALSCIG